MISHDLDEGLDESSGMRNLKIGGMMMVEGLRGVNEGGTEVTTLHGTVRGTVTITTASCCVSHRQCDSR